jgi:hypothetical protein
MTFGVKVQSFTVATRGKSMSHKTRKPLLHLGILRNVNNFYKIVDILYVPLKTQQLAAWAGVGLVN